MTCSSGYFPPPYLDGVRLENSCGCGDCKEEEIYNFKSICQCPHCKNIHPHPVPMWTMNDVDGNPVGPIPPAIIDYPPFSDNFTFTYTDPTKMTERKYLPTLSELIDRLSICQLKDVFITEHKKEYAKEIEDIMHDIDLCLWEPGEEEDYKHISAEFIRNVIVLSQMNLHIWHNESNWRKGIRKGNNLELTHGLNGIRNTAKNRIQSVIGGRKDYKVDNVEAFKNWVPSGWEEKKCEKCGGEGWLWGKELDNPTEDTYSDSMTKYTCDGCGGEK